MKINASPQITAGKRKKKGSYYLIRNWQIYSMLIPGIAFFLLFKYVPLFGTVIAFQDYNVFKGISGSPFVGLKHFEDFFSNQKFFDVLRNTILISFYKLIFGFPAPILLAMLLNEVRKLMFKRTIQTLIYLPHFLSWVIVGGMVINMLSPTFGIVNSLIQSLGFEPIFFLQEPQYFRSIVVLSGIWKEVGWSTIIYLAAMAGINPEMYEAAEVDGASRLRKAISVTLPSIMPTIVVLLLLRIGDILDLGFEQVYMLLNPIVKETGDIIDTYIYDVGLLGFQYSYTTGIGLFKSIVGLILIIGANKLGKKLTGNSIY